MMTSLKNCLGVDTTIMTPYLVVPPIGKIFGPSIKIFKTDPSYQKNMPSYVCESARENERVPGIKR